MSKAVSGTTAAAAASAKTINTGRLRVGVLPIFVVPHAKQVFGLVGRDWSGAKQLLAGGFDADVDTSPLAGAFREGREESRGVLTFSAPAATLAASDSAFVLNGTHRYEESSNGVPQQLFLCLLDAGAAFSDESELLAVLNQRYHEAHLPLRDAKNVWEMTGLELVPLTQPASATAAGVTTFASQQFDSTLASCREKVSALLSDSAAVAGCPRWNVLLERRLDPLFWYKGFVCAACGAAIAHADDAIDKCVPRPTVDGVQPGLCRGYITSIVPSHEKKSSCKIYVTRLDLSKDDHRPARYITFPGWTHNGDANFWLGLNQARLASAPEVFFVAYDPIRAKARNTDPYAVIKHLTIKTAADPAAAA